MLPEEALSQAARQLAFDLRTRWLNELVVFHAGRASRHACHAAQAIVHVQTEAAIKRTLALCRFLDHVNAAARRIHLFVPQHIRGACGQAKSAVHAIVDVLLLRRMMRVKTRGALG